MNTQKILVIKTGALGDFVTATGAFKAIRNHHRCDHITLMTAEPYRCLGQNCGWFDEVILDPRPKLSDIKGCLAWARNLRAAGYRRVYDLQRRYRQTLSFLAMRWGQPGLEWVGVAPLASHRIRDRKTPQIHAFCKWCEQLAAGGISSVPEPDLDWLDDDVEGFHLPDRVALLIPGSSPHRWFKRWADSGYGMLARELVNQEITPLIIGGVEEYSLAVTIRYFCPQAIDLMGKTSLGALASLARHALLCVGNDTGPAHLAAIAGAPSLILMCHASHPEGACPRGRSCKVLWRDELAELDIEDVLEAALPMLEK